MRWEARYWDARCKAQLAKEKWDGVIPNPVFFLCMVVNHLYETYLDN